MTGILIQLSPPLVPSSGSERQLRVSAATVGDSLRELSNLRPALRDRIFRADGRLRRDLAVFLNGTDIRNLEGNDTSVRDGDELRIVPSLSGGSGRRVPTRSALRRSHASARPPTRKLPTGPRAELRPEEMRRYGRHLLLPEIGLGGQERLKASKVAIVGAGGLGAPAALYLAAAGVGEIGLIDFDRVDVSNLQRQVLFGTSDVGRSKIEAGRARLRELNPNVRIRPVHAELGPKNVLRVLGPYDVVLDGTDNFPARYLINDACVALGKPDVFGAIFRFEGQASVFDARSGPCYRCLFPEPPPAEAAPSCAEAGVLGVLPGLIGLIQATEVLKLLLGEGTSLSGRLLLFDALGMRFRELEIAKDPGCPRCGRGRAHRPLRSMAAQCALPESPADEAREISPAELRRALDRPQPPLLLDVREPFEYAVSHLPGALLIPQRDLPERLGELRKASEVVVYCRRGNRSANATRLLTSLGVRRVRSLTGGLTAWAQRYAPELPVA
ncbi:MAG TPA: molybdopterin-synthase adenylyltransferase MoeB [Thermoplasmata archaeon]|nr:molybdopterin-synthase adenylyltransferase MoeB [Thermoplasmata archaeon]